MSRNTRETPDKTTGSTMKKELMPQWIPDTSTGWVPLSSIVGWDRNPNRHPPAQRAQLAASFRRFGFIDAVTIARIGDEGVLELRAGHGRVEGLNDILREDPEFVPHGAPGPGLVRALIFDFPTRAAADAYGIANNRLAEIADPDEEAVAAILREFDADGFSLDGLGWADGELESLLKAAVPEPDDAPSSSADGATLTDDLPDDVPIITKPGEVIPLGRHTLHCASCIDVANALPENSIDAIAGDAPYGLSPDGRARTWDEVAALRLEGKGPRGGFMGKEWDSGVPGAEWARAMFRILKPGGHLAVFCGTRTDHRMICALEDAGFEIREKIHWQHYQGFPKSLNVSKALADAGQCCLCSQPMIHSANVQTKDMRSLRPTVDATNTRSSSAEPELLQGLQGQAHQREAAGGSQGQGSSVLGHQDVPGVRGALRAPSVVGKEAASGVLLEDLRRPRERPGARRAPQPPRRVDPQPASEGGGPLHGAGQPIVEGRRDEEGPAWELRRGGDDQVPGGPAVYGAQQRLRPSAQGGDGEDRGSGADESGGSSPHQPQPEGQPAGKPPAVSNQPGSQDVRGWPVCGRCNLAVVPEGLGTALKPAIEPAVLCRKPLSEDTVAANVLRWGTGALNIDGCRYAEGDTAWPGPGGEVQNMTEQLRGGSTGIGAVMTGQENNPPHPLGRFPANVYHCPKPASSERERGMDESPVRDANKWNSGGIGERRRAAGLGFARNTHPTVKPIRLMTWIVRLITPPGGRLFAPFIGSGTDLLAGEAVGVTVEGCELEPAYCDIARARFLGQVKEAEVTHG